MHSIVKASVDRMVEEIMAGTAPWRRSWITEFPTNAVTGSPYRGMNMILLWQKEYQTQEWAGYHQWKSIGAQVRKGEKATYIMSRRKGSKEVDGEPTWYNYYRAVKVFNAAQVDGYSKDQAPPNPELCHENAQADFLMLGIRLKHGPDPAYYPLRDYMTLPPPENFVSMDAYWQTKFHELVHATGHESRLNRDGITGKYMKESVEYAVEELVAEIGAAALYSHYQMQTPLSEFGDAAYLQGYLNRVPQGQRSSVLMQAASKASEAMHFVLNTNMQEEAA